MQALMGMVLVLASVQEKEPPRQKVEYGKHVYVGGAIEMEVLPYCTCTECCGDDPNSKAGKTATGKDAKKYVDGVIADPRLLPYGMRLFIPNVGERVVDDTGSRAKAAGDQGKYRIAFRVKNHDEVLAIRKRIGGDTTKMVVILIEEVIEKK